MPTIPPIKERIKKRMKQFTALKAEISDLKRKARVDRKPAKGLGGVVQYLREERGWILSELADKAKLSKGVVHNIETNKCSPRVNTLQKLAIPFGIEASDILARAEARELNSK